MPKRRFMADPFKNASSAIKKPLSPDSQRLDDAPREFICFSPHLRHLLARFQCHQSPIQLPKMLFCCGTRTYDYRLRHASLQVVVVPWSLVPLGQNEGMNEVLALLMYLRALFCRQLRLTAENLVLRQQLAMYDRS